MFYLLSVAYCIGYVLQAQLVSAYECQCGRPSDAIVSMRIVGGRRAEPHSFPWTVAILKYDRMHCGAALITDRHLLSAGHCFKWDDFRIMDVLIGLDNMNDLKDVEKRNISDVIIHEHFTSSAVRDENDIAIATINRPVRFSDTIIPVCLPTPGQDFAERVATIVGWGRIGVDKQSSRVLLKASLKILTDDECMQSKLAPHLKPTMMCAFSKGKDGCQGDSGGPLLVFETDGKYVQAGVVSWGIGCADPRYPGVYTKVSQYTDWITRHTANGRGQHLTRRQRQRRPYEEMEKEEPWHRSHRMLQRQMKHRRHRERRPVKTVRHYKEHGRVRHEYKFRRNMDEDSVVDYHILDSE